MKKDKKVNDEKSELVVSDVEADDRVKAKEKPNDQDGEKDTQERMKNDEEDEHQDRQEQAKSQNLQMEQNDGNESVNKRSSPIRESVQEPQKRRRWGNTTNNASDSDDQQNVTISTDTLQDILDIPKAKSPTNSAKGVWKYVQGKGLVNKTADLEEDNKDANLGSEKNKSSDDAKEDLKTNYKSNKSNKNNRREKKKNRSSRNGGSYIADGMGNKEESRRKKSSSKRGSSCSIRVEGFIRPLITKSVERLFSEFGKIEVFWLSPIKDYCYVTYSNAEEAKSARDHVHGLCWPDDERPPLDCELCDSSEVKDAVKEKSKKVRKKKDRPTAPLDMLFKRTRAKPQIYWLPVAAKDIKQEKEGMSRKKIRKHREGRERHSRHRREEEYGRHRKEEERYERYNRRHGRRRRSRERSY